MKMNTAVFAVAVAMLLTACGTTVTLKPNGQSESAKPEAVAVSLQGLDVKSVIIRDANNETAVGEEAARTFVDEISPNLVGNGVPVAGEGKGDVTIRFTMTYSFQYVKTLFIPLPIPIPMPQKKFSVVAAVEKDGKPLFAIISVRGGGAATSGSFLGSGAAKEVAAKVADNLKIAEKPNRKPGNEPVKTVLLPN